MQLCGEKINATFWKKKTNSALKRKDKCNFVDKRQMQLREEKTNATTSCFSGILHASEAADLRRHLKMHSGEK